MRLTCLLLLFISVKVASAQPEANQVNHLHKQKFAWLISRQYDSLEIFLDDRLQYIHSNGWIQSKREVIDELKKGKPVYEDIKVEESAVVLYPNCAIVTGKGTFKGKQADQTSFDIHLLYTEVYVKFKKQWRLVNRQAIKI